MKDKVRIIEVGPRDGLQNEKKVIPTEDKVTFIERLVASGLEYIEVGSFVSTEKVPQLADTSEVLEKLDFSKNVHFSALVPNLMGIEAALQTKLKHIALFTAASETFNAHNIHASIDESIARFKPVIALAHEHNIHVRIYISCVLGCPYEGKIAIDKVVELVNICQDLGVTDISLGDTIGVGTPKTTLALLDAVLRNTNTNNIAMHFHNTYGQALANIYVSLEKGIRRFDSSAAGLGGCPYAPGASGNVATEDVLYMMEGLGLETGVDIRKVAEAGEAICRILGRENDSKVARAYHK